MCQEDFSKSSWGNSPVSAAAREPLKYRRGSEFSSRKNPFHLFDISESFRCKRGGQAGILSRSRGIAHRNASSRIRGRRCCLHADAPAFEKLKESTDCGALFIVWRRSHFRAFAVQPHESPSGLIPPDGDALRYARHWAFERQSLYKWPHAA